MQGANGAPDGGEVDLLERLAVGPGVAFHEREDVHDGLGLALVGASDASSLAGGEVSGGVEGGQPKTKSELKARDLSEGGAFGRSGSGIVGTASAGSAAAPRLPDRRQSPYRRRDPLEGEQLLCGCA